MFVTLCVGIIYTNSIICHKSNTFTHNLCLHFVTHLASLCIFKIYPLLFANCTFQNASYFYFFICYMFSDGMFVVGMQTSPIELTLFAEYSRTLKKRPNPIKFRSGSFTTIFTKHLTEWVLLQQINVFLQTYLMTNSNGNKVRQDLMGRAMAWRIETYRLQQQAAKGSFLCKAGVGQRNQYSGKSFSE